MLKKDKNKEVLPRNRFGPIGRFEIRNTFYLRQKIQSKNFINKYFKKALSLIDNEDFVIPVIESFNQNREEALLFVYNRNCLVFVLWENINPQRGAYIFQYEQENLEQSVIEIKNLVRNKIEKKRETFQRGQGVKFFNLNCKKYHLIKHTNVEAYYLKLRKIMNV